MSELSAAVKVEEISPVKKKLTIDVPGRMSKRKGTPYTVITAEK